MREPKERGKQRRMRSYKSNRCLFPFYPNIYSKGKEGKGGRDSRKKMVPNGKGGKKEGSWRKRRGKQSFQTIRVGKRKIGR